MHRLLRRLLGSLAVFAATSFVGGLGFWWIGDGAWALPDCIYMAVISATTVGFGELLPGMETLPAARAWAVLVILLGVATFGYTASMLTAFIVENDLAATFRKKTMRKQIHALSGHVVVCGAGSTGRHVVTEMLATRTPCVAIDVDARRLGELEAEVAPATLLHIVGDATEDAVLEQAGIARARGVVAALPDDKDNLFVVVSARGANPTARIVSRGHDVRTAEKLRKAGANSVVSPNMIGGLRLASELVRPNVLEFLDLMLRDKDKNLRIEEVDVTDRSPLAGRSLRDSRLRDVTDALVLAVRQKADRTFAYNPGPDTRIEPGTTLVVMGTVDSVTKLRRFLEPSGETPA